MIDNKMINLLFNAIPAKNAKSYNELEQQEVDQLGLDRMAF